MKKVDTSFLIHRKLITAILYPLNLEARVVLLIILILTFTSTHFSANGLFLQPLKISVKLWFSVLRGEYKGNHGLKGLHFAIMNLQQHTKLCHMCRDVKPHNIKQKCPKVLQIPSATYNSQWLLGLSKTWLDAKFEPKNVSYFFCILPHGLGHWD